MIITLKGQKDHPKQTTIIGTQGLQSSSWLTRVQLQKVFVGNEDDRRDHQKTQKTAAISR
jgi:hypothetical protein